MDFTYEDDNLDLFLHNANIVYYGFRPQDSSVMHEKLLKQHFCSKPSKPSYNLIDIGKRRKKTSTQIERPIGMVRNDGNYEFDSYFESGNLDIAVKVSEDEYDLYMRVDSNTIGRNQWFYFSIKPIKARTIKLNILNFTKNDSLYRQGMRISIHSPHKLWHKGGENITYKPSKLTQELSQRTNVLIFVYKSLGRPIMS